jgi:hypothetical protein
MRHGNRLTCVNNREISCNMPREHCEKREGNLSFTQVGAFAIRKGEHVQFIFGHPPNPPATLPEPVGLQRAHNNMLTYPQQYL